MQKHRLRPSVRDLGPGKDQVGKRGVRAVNENDDTRTRGMEPLGAALGRILARAERNHLAHVRPLVKPRR